VGGALLDAALGWHLAVARRDERFQKHFQSHVSDFLCVRA
jgi:hypothetical protein